MYRICVLVLLVTSCWAARPRPRHRPPAPPRPRPRPLLRIYKGHDDTTGRYPYVVALLQNKRNILLRMCTGSLLSPTWVLTASHCTVEPGNPSEIQYGNMSQLAAESTTRSRILNKFLHPSFRMTAFRKGALSINSDIALLKVEPVHLRVFGNISAVDFKTLTGRAVDCAGYGSTFLDKTPDRLKVALEDQRRPLQLAEGVIVPCDHTRLGQYLCVAPKCSDREQGLLPGDSGSSLFYEGKIVGVAMGVEPASGNMISKGMFTGISPFINWINVVITQESD